MIPFGLYSHGEELCFDLVDTYCSGIVPFTSCYSTSCVNNVCPHGTTKIGPTAESFTDIVQPAYENPFETFSLISTVYCRYRVVCDACDEGLCKNTVSAYEEPTHPNVSEELTKPIAQGGYECWFE
jgi:hypothetical protein